MKTLHIFLFTIITGCLFNLASYSQSEIGKGDEIFGFQGVFQKWLYVNDDNPIIAIEGYITKIKLNSNGNPWDDLDWNVFINPTDESRWCIFNSLAQKNADDQIELEVKSRLTDIREFFNVGDFVLAKGKWVEDTGHGASDWSKPARWDVTYKPVYITVWGHKVLVGVEPVYIEIRGKTEIHPINFLRTGSSIFAPNIICFTPDVDTKIFMAQDASRRFYAADDFPIEETFTFAANENTMPFFVINLLNDQEGTGDVDIYHERTNIKGGTIASLSHIDEELIYRTYIPPYISGEGGAFMGVFNNEKNDVLKYETTVTPINGDQPGTDGLRFEVRIELQDLPGADPFIKRWWTYGVRLHFDVKLIFMETKTTADEERNQARTRWKLYPEC